MYYLLADNRIIDSEKEDVYVNEYRGIKWVHQNKHKTCLGYIKKQSENVYDLIEEGDLVGDYDYFRGIVTKIDILDNEAIYLQVNQEYYHRSEDFTKFYKPDEKGNYIKVWEVKEDEKE